MSPNLPYSPTRRKASLTFMVPWYVNTHCQRISAGSPDSQRLLLASQGSESSRELYATFLDRMRTLYKPEKIQGSNPSLVSYSLPAFRIVSSLFYYLRLCIDGVFGAMMNVSLTNEVCDNLAVNVSTSFPQPTLVVNQSDHTRRYF